MQPDSISEDQIKQLTDMGFSREQAQGALLHCQNSVVLAVDWLINHPSSPPQQPVVHPVVPIIPSPPIFVPPHPFPIPNPNPHPNPPPSQPSASLAVLVEDNILKIGEHLCITFERTLRVPDDGKIYPLPPSMGQFPVLRVDDFLDRVPESWRTTGGVFIPLFQREACFIQFHGNHNHPCAVKVAVGKVNAISGQPWSHDLKSTQNDYVCVPDQPWLDGINNGNGTIKQFVAMPLGQGYTVEAQVTGKEVFGGFQILCFNSKNRVPDFWSRREREHFAVPLAGVNATCEEADAYSGFSSQSTNAPAPPPPAPITAPRPPASMGPHPPVSMAAPAQSKKSISGAGSVSPPASMAALSEASWQMSDMQISPSGARPSFNSEAIAEELSSCSRSSSSSSSSRAPVTEHEKQPSRQAQVEGAREMGLAAGGTIKQAIFSDPYGINSWDQSKFGRVFVHIINSQMWTQITGQAPPETPISAKTYSSHGFPWFDLYEENASTVPASSTLAGVKTVKQVDQEKYAWPQQDDSSIQLSGSQVHQLPGKSPDPQHSVRDGSW